MAEAVRRRLTWIGDRSPGDVAGVSAALGGAAGVTTGLTLAGLDLAVVSAAAGIGAAAIGGAGMGLWALSRPVRTATEEPSGRPRIFSDRVPAVPHVFVGRDELVAQLTELVDQGGTRVLSQAIQGLGGVGKTTAAAAVAEAVRDRVAVVWWARSEEPAVLVADIAELAGRLGLPDQDDLAETARSARRWLEETDDRWLIVFDNVPGPEALEEWLPRRGHGAVLITTRNADVYRLADVITVDTLPPDIAERFLRQRVTSPGQRGDASNVVERLGGLPLALEQAAAWVARTPTRTFLQFVELYDDAAHDPFEDGTRPIGYEHTATTTWRVSINDANKESALAGPLLEALSFVAPDDLPCAWLRAQARHDFLDGAGIEAIDAALTALHAYALIKLTPDGIPGLGDTVSIHRVIQAATRRGAVAAAAGFAIDVLHAVASVCVEAHDPKSWPPLATLVPHALAAAGTTRAALPGHAESLCRVLTIVLDYHMYSGAVRDAMAAAVIMRDIGVMHLGEDHRLVLTNRSNLGNVYSQIGNYAHAVMLLEAVLADRERVLGDDDYDTLRSRNSLASAYRDSGDLERSIPLYQRTILDSERVLGRDHRDTLIVRANLAVAFLMAADFDDAIPQFESVLDDMKRVLGDDHPDTLSYSAELASACQQSGDLDRAVALFETVLPHQERILGPDHRWTMATRKKLEQVREASRRRGGRRGEPGSSGVGVGS